MSKKIVILGVNGFIGSHLVERIVDTTNWTVAGIDLASDKISHVVDHPRFSFLQGSIFEQQAWIEKNIQEADVVLPLVAIANPTVYVNDPLRIFELDFESNLDIIRLCVKHKKRVIFPSTSEVYGMCPDEAFNEEESNLVTGPIQKERWIYSCSKQLLDRVIYAHGKRDQLDFTLFRPFNWIGPKLDHITDKPGNARVLTQFISNLIYGKDIQLVNDGQQRRCFTYIDDGIDALLKIIANENNCATQRIINIGNPHCNHSIRELAETLMALAKTHEAFADKAKKVHVVGTKAEDYYGKGYQDIDNRVPSIDNAQRYLGWAPSTDLKTAVSKTLDYYAEVAMATEPV